MLFNIYALAVIVFLTSCGFKPIYGVDSDEEFRCSLAEIQITALQSNQSYKLKNYLEDEFNPNNESREKLFNLSVKIEDIISDLLVQQDSTIIAKQHNMNASYVLNEKYTQKIIDSGNIRLTISFNELHSEYATYVIADKSYDNGLKQLAMVIKKRLIIAMIKYNNLPQHEDKS